MAQHLSNLPLGALVKFGKHIVNTEAAQSIIWRVVDKNHSGYPTDSVTLITDKIIDMRECDAKESSSTLYGHYAYSNINQWLNSNGTANNWYVAAHSKDVAPSYASLPGFLYNFTENERNAILPTTLTTQYDKDISKSIVAKVFLPSMWELLGTHFISDNSTRFAGFVSASVASTLTPQAFANTTSIYKPATVDTAIKYYTRNTSNSDSSSSGNIYTMYITSTGGSSSDFPNDKLGIRPCTNLSANAKVSDTTDSDGCYTVLFNTPPVISRTNGDLGVKSIGFTETYSVSESDSGDSITVSEYIDNTKVRSYVATSGATNTFTVQNTTWWGLTNGIHTMKIVATDGFDTVERTFTFTKSVNSLVVQRTTPIESASRPKTIIVSVVKNIPVEAIFKVEVCNNGFASSPTWEVITDKVNRGDKYDFQNTDLKGSSKWGVNIRVTVERNGAEGACYITEIGGNFE